MTERKRTVPVVDDEQDAVRLRHLVQAAGFVEQLRHEIAFLLPG
jgi:hypothetical protein